MVDFQAMMGGDTRMLNSVQIDELQVKKPETAMDQAVKREDKMNACVGRYDRTRASTIVVDIDMAAAPPHMCDEGQLAATLLQGVYFKVADDPQGNPVFRQERRVGGEELFCYKVICLSKKTCSSYRLLLHRLYHKSCATDTACSSYSL